MPRLLYHGWKRVLENEKWRMAVEIIVGTELERIMEILFGKLDELR